MTKKQKRMLMVILVSAVLFVAAYFLPLFGLWKTVVFLIPYAIAGFPVWKKAVGSIFRGQMLDENFLMAMASAGAFLLGEASEGVAVVLFYRIGEFFESYAVGKSRDSVSRLLSLCPDEATVFRNGEWITVSPEEIHVGESVRVLAGEKIPLDGTVQVGSSSLDTRSLTGESLPRDVSVGDSVLSGCINLTGTLVILAEKEAGESTASKILALVEDASAHRSKSESFVTSFARWYTPAVLGVSLLVGVVPPLFTGDWASWIYRGLEFLVVSCPCALVISVPLAYFGGIGGASRKGILIKGSDSMESLAKADTFVFDKTGTLTDGVFAVTSVEGEDQEKILEIAALCEQFSNHPIARSLREAWGKPLSEDRISEHQELAGFGVRAKVDGVLYFVGNRRWMERLGHSTASGIPHQTCVYVATEQSLLGVIYLSDRIKESAFSSISDLKKVGIRRTVLLSGDRSSAAQWAAETLNMDEFYGELLPQDKVSALADLSSKAKGNVVFVGDGMNDAPVLSYADVGIAMGGFGSDAALEAADVVLMHDDLTTLSKAVLLARKTHRIVLENMIFSIAVKVLVMILCAFGYATMWHAVFADVGVSILAILNAMRCLSKK